MGKVFKVRRVVKEMDWDLNVDLKPCMDVLTVLIPFLVVFASFAAVKILEVNLPELNQMQAPPKDKEDEGLLLTVFISDKGLTLGARGAILPTTYTQEYHRYEYQFPRGAEGPVKTYLVKIDKLNRKESPACPLDKNRRLSLVERAEIILYVVERANEDDPGSEIMALYDKAGQVMANNERVIQNKLPQAGDTLYALSILNPYREVVRNPGDYRLGKLTAYDQLASRLIRIQSMYPSVPDQGEIKIIAEDDVMFDKIIHVMDVCRDFGFPKISLGKLAG
ncbi:MAG: hypothetical protein V1913_06785 [Fibrobacterota bacterium]